MSTRRKRVGAASVGNKPVSDEMLVLGGHTSDFAAGRAVRRRQPTPHADIGQLPSTEA